MLLKGMKKRILLSIFLMLTLVTFVHASFISLGIYPSNQDLELKQLCGDCTYNNITSIVFPNGTNVGVSYPISMSQSGSQFTYTLNSNYTQAIGTYTVNGVGDSSGEDTVWAYNFDINGVGQEFDQARSIFYVGVMIILLILFVFGVMGFNALPSEDPKDFEGKLIDVNWLKYVRYIVGIICWGLLTMMSFLAWNVSVAFLGTSLVATIFEVLFRFLMFTLMIGTPIMLWWIVVKAFQDKKMKRYIERGLM